MGDGGSELERAAARNRARDAKQERRAKPRPPSRDTLKRALWAESLGGSAGFTIAEFVFGGLALVAPIYPIYVLWGEQLGDFWASVVTVPFCVVAMWAQLRIREAIGVAWRARGVRRIGYGLDADAYFELLSVRHRDGDLRVRLTCARAWTPQELADVRAAVPEWASGVRAETDGSHEVTLVTGPIEGTAFISGDGDTVRWFTNRLLHDAFTRIVRRVVGRLHAVNPVERIEVQATGEVVSFDVEP